MGNIISKKRGDTLIKALLSFYPKWQRPILKLLAKIIIRKPKIKLTP